MTAPADIVFMIDVDNTLLDNDKLIAALMAHIEQQFGVDSRVRYQAILEDLRTELGYVDYLGAMQRFRAADMNAPHMLGMAAFLIDYPFADLLYPKALEVLAYLRKWGPVVIVSDGDVVFQPRKIERSGLWNAVDGNVLIYVHKEQMCDDIARRYPARRYVMIDDKQRILTAMQAAMPAPLTTVFPRQGHYALDPANVALYTRPDITVAAIGDLLTHDFSGLAAPAAATPNQLT